MEELKLIPCTDKLLKTPTIPFTDESGIDPKELVDKMLKLARENGGIGLAANQIGLPYSVFVIVAEPAFACFNPKIVHFSEEQSYMDEGCLSEPGMLVNIKRPNEVRLRFTNFDGTVVTKVFKGITARVVQHEMDHLNGVSPFSRATRYHLEKAKKNKGKYKREVVFHSANTQSIQTNFPTGAM